MPVATFRGLSAGIQESCSVSESLDPADKPQEVGKLSLHSLLRVTKFHINYFVEKSYKKAHTKLSYRQIFTMINGVYVGTFKASQYSQND